jgi:DNA replication and repair protein RecF
VTRAVVIESLSIRGFRNLASIDVSLASGLNVVSGENGQGKTNLLEAVYALATSRSFRTGKLTDVLPAADRIASVRGRVHEGNECREQSIGIRHGARSVRMDGKRPATLAAYAVRTPTVVFHPAAVAIASGSGAERRRLLDRIALYLSPSSIEEAESYRNASRARQRVLDSRGESARDLDGWEELIVKHGMALSHARAEAAALLVPAAEGAFARIAGSSVVMRGSYARSAPLSEDAFRGELKRSRARDRARGSIAVGPHRDDLALELGDMPVRSTASQGQQRAVVLALELAEIDIIVQARGVRPLLLLDDVSSELDRARTAALFRALRDEDGQVLLTTTRPDLIEHAGTPHERRDFLMDQGRITRA